MSHITAYQITELTAAKSALDNAGSFVEREDAFDAFVAITDDLRQNDPAAYIAANAMGLTR